VCASGRREAREPRALAAAREMADVCPEVVQQEFGDGSRVFGLVVFVAYSVLLIATVIGWKIRSDFQWLRKRCVQMMMLTGIGVWMLLVVTLLGNFSGRQTFPCDAQGLLVHFSIVLILSPVLARLVVIYTTFRYNQLLLNDNFLSTNGFDASTFQRLGYKESAKAVLRFVFITCGSVTVAVNDTVERMSSAVVRSAKISGKKQSSGAINVSLDQKFGPRATAREKRRFNQAIIDEAKATADRKNNIAVAMFLLTRRWLLYVIVGLNLLFVGIAVAVIYTLEDSAYFKGCVGCNLFKEDIILLSTYVSIVGALGLLILWKVRNETDPLGMIQEIKWLYFIGFIGSVFCIFGFVDLNEIRLSGAFDLFQLTALAKIALHFVQGPLQVWKTYKIEETAVKGGGEEIPAHLQKMGVGSKIEDEEVYNNDEDDNDVHGIMGPQQRSPYANHRQAPYQPPHYQKQQQQQQQQQHQQQRPDRSGNDPSQRHRNGPRQPAMRPVDNAFGGAATRIGAHPGIDRRGNSSDHPGRRGHLGDHHGRRREQSFDTMGRLDMEKVTLDKVLKTREGRKIFKEYLATEFGVEKLLFMDAMEKYRKMYRGMNNADATAAANVIYSTFIQDGSMLRIGASRDIQLNITRILGNPVAQRPPIEVFDAAAVEAYRRLAVESFPRFKKSPFFEKWAMPGLGV